MSSGGVSDFVSKSMEGDGVEWGVVERAWLGQGKDNMSGDLTNVFFLLKLALRAKCLKFSLFLET